MHKYREVSQCRSCQAPLEEEIVSLGNTPLANSLLTKDQLPEAEPSFPLDLYLCKNCSLVQIKQTIPSDVLFKNYFYFSSYSDTMLSSAREIANRMAETKKLDEDSLVIELASNDGYLLQYYVEKNIPVLGIDPAENIAKVARERGVETLANFFSKDLALQLASQNRYADILHANNVLAHVPEINDFVEGIKIILKPQGVAVIEVPYLFDMIEKNEFDTIYHEHLFYFSLTALSKLFERAGLKIADVEKLPIHGGSLRLFVCHSGAPQSAKVEQMMSVEDDLKVSSAEYYKSFSDNITKNKNVLLSLLADLKSSGKSIAAYGASAKGSTLLNVFGIDTNFLDFVVDRSQKKQGLYTPGSRLPIYAPEVLLEKMPDYLLLLTWNFKEEILKQQLSYTEKGGKFIIPVPVPEII